MLEIKMGLHRDTGEHLAGEDGQLIASFRFKPDAELFVRAKQRLCSVCGQEKLMFFNGKDAGMVVMACGNGCIASEEATVSRVYTMADPQAHLSPAARARLEKEEAEPWLTDPLPDLVIEPPK